MCRLFTDRLLYSLWFEVSNQQTISEFYTQNERPVKAEEHEAESAAPSEEIIPVYDERYEQAAAYNRRIFEEHQANITDAWTFDENDLSFDWEDPLFGCIEIPAMEVTLPLYLGATTETMGKGAVILGETSLPIGGINTNSVIAGHRGYRGAPYFREIERLKAGDIVFVTNPWEELTYQVVELAIVQPDDSDAVKIQPDRDMLTLVTCHPYRSHGKYRYLVYCQRVDYPDAEELPEVHHVSSETEEQSYSGTVEFQTSEPEIQEEHTLRTVGAVIILILVIISIYHAARKG